jgi:uncharacterized sulfatase
MTPQRTSVEVFGRIRIVIALFAMASVSCAPVSHSDRSGEESQPPNIVIAISDDQSFPHASAYGSAFVSTPAFDRVARDGALFMRAYAASPGCSPSRAALLTGRHTWMLEAAGAHASGFPARYQTIPDILEAAGYHVGYTGKGWAPGDWETTRPRNPAGPAYNERRFDAPPAGVSKIDYAANFSAFLDQRTDNKPFYFWFGALEPHRAYDDGAGRRAGKTLTDDDVPAYLPKTETVKSDIADYAVEIEWFDAQLGAVLDQLEAEGELDNTLIIVTSDNGMPFPRAKANVYDAGIHVPLAISWPAQSIAGAVIDDLVSFVDITATIYDAANVEADGLTGTSFLNRLRGLGAPDPDKAAYAARERHSSARWNNHGYPQRAIRVGDYLYIRNLAPERWPAGAPRKFDDAGVLGPPHDAYHDIDRAPALAAMIDKRSEPAFAPLFNAAVDLRPAEELYDVENDPANLKNLAADPAYADIRDELSARLTSYLEETGDPRMHGRGDIWDAYPRLRGVMRSFPKPDWAEGSDE